MAARDIENGLEDVVSILEAALKAMARRRLQADGNPVNQVDKIVAKTVRNQFQSYDGATKTLEQLFGLDLSGALDRAAGDQFRRILEKRHPITHNLGIVDRKYLDKVRTGEAEGRDVTLNEQEVLKALDTVLVIVRFVHGGLFP